MNETGTQSVFQALQAGEHLLAAQRARAFLADHPTDGEGWFMLGIAERALGDPRSAAESYRRALVTHSGHADVWFNLGNALIDCNEAEQALTAFQTAAERQSDHQGALRQVVRLAQSQSRPDLAADAAARLSALDPDNLDAVVSQLRALRQGNRWTEAMALFQKALPKGLEHGGLLLEGGQLLERQGDHRALAVLYERLDRLMPDNALVKFQLGLNLLRTQRFTAGLAALRAAEALGLNERPLWVNLGMTLMREVPEDAFLYTGTTDREALEAVRTLARSEGIICALETAHAVHAALTMAPSLKTDSIILINLSGRGDKDMETAMQWFKLAEPTGAVQ